MHGQGPFQMQKAIISILAAQIFPRPIWSLRWRHRAFDVAVFLQKYIRLVPRREPCRLLKERPGPVPWLRPGIEVETVPDTAVPA